MNQSGPYPPPTLPEGWIALWDQTAQRYYYVQTATGQTQWEVPTQPSSTVTQPQGEASSYGAAPGGNVYPSYDNKTSGYPPVSGSNAQQPYYPYDQQQPQQPQQQPQQNGDGQDRGLGSMISGLVGGGRPHQSGGSGFPMGAAGGALAGSLVG
ncbi:hypothetical protein EC973_002316 [Apophysomyces ossiformis]|uniref:WW domain-containing protein n=1 Tax=Apophysomyces ossiformis TaxID=679940 RepID=A0A8H7BNW2_9FUNG|nr:hypothetical protein EC973_002316 [Apophysomyces ossiformis]